MDSFHFVEDYERHVAHLIASHPIDEAMALAVGGNYEHVGQIELDVLRFAGLRNGATLFDLGCGSGRLAHAVSKAIQIEYVGSDVVQALLDYAATRTPASYRFLLHRRLDLPMPDTSCDMVAAFSVFTHLLHEETYLYLEDARRILKPGGKLVFSFLEFADPAHWNVFQSTADGRRNNARSPLNMFMERDVIDTWSAKLGFRREAFVSGTEAPWGEHALWQSVAMLSKAD